MTETKRVESIRFFLKLNKKKFSELLGYSYPQNYTKYLKGGTTLSLKAIKAIKSHNDRISLDWLLTGKGEMFLSEQSQSIVQGDGGSIQSGNKNYHGGNNVNVNVEHLREKIALLEKSVADKEELIQLLKEKKE